MAANPLAESYPFFREFQFALETVRCAAQLTQQFRAETASPTLIKSDRSPVTAADFAAQALVGSLVAQTFPDDPLVAEEDAADLRRPAGSSLLARVTNAISRFFPCITPQAVCDAIDRGTAVPARRFWTLDPVDGTKGFLRGGQYAVALALLVNGQVEIGVLGCPGLTEASHPAHGGPGSLVAAARGQGAWSTPLHVSGEFTRLHVSQKSDPGEARLLRSFEADHTHTKQLDDVIRALGTRAPSLAMDSQAKYAVLAAGAGDLLLRLLSPKYPNYREKIWDQAAGSLIVEEAGGRISDLEGQPLDFTAGRTLARNRGVLASNGYLHAVALQTVRQVQRGYQS
ncbi:MAG TPA: 3'(2'),5'-bisphosphate nucleotidase [Candidatus Binatia bacterium]|jgi:3'(2'), 5'-bisphosphate nucleotidase|nr:3'(2'),5'-bisphosphate nucleotidase [Candidatus Binatia bacterium]